MNLILKHGAPVRTAFDVGPGDYIKVIGGWKKIKSNPAEGQSSLSRSCRITTEDGRRYYTSAIYQYALAADLVRVVRRANC